jgi:hypothetical protein
MTLEKCGIVGPEANIFYDYVPFAYPLIGWMIVTTFNRHVKLAWINDKQIGKISIIIEVLEQIARLQDGNATSSILEDSSLTFNLILDANIIILFMIV